MMPRQIDIPTIDMKSPICDTYDGHTPVVHDNNRDFRFSPDATPFIQEIAYLSTNAGKRSTITATVVDGVLELQVDKSPQATRVPWRVLVQFDYNPGVQNVGQNGWWIRTGTSNTCHYTFGHSVGAIQNVKLRWQH